VCSRSLCRGHDVSFVGLTNSLLLTLHFTDYLYIYVLRTHICINKDIYIYMYTYVYICISIHTRMNT